MSSFTIICVNIGGLKALTFGTNGKFMVLVVPVLTHIRVHIKFFFSIVAFTAFDKGISLCLLVTEMHKFCFQYCYRKNSKNWDPRNNYHNCPSIGTVGFYSAVLCSKDADRITNREDPDQTAP